MIAQTATSSFKQELLQGVHDFSVDTFKLALYTAEASLGAGTTTYTTSGEVVASGYTAGGADLTVSTPPTLSGGTAVIGFANVTWAAALTARGGLIYNASKANRAVAVLNFGADKTSSAAFTVTFPPALADAAIIRIS